MSDTTHRPPQSSAARICAVAALCGLLSVGAVAKDLPPPPAMPDADNKIAQPQAVFSGLDKITGRIISFDVAIDETVQFGALQVTPRACYSRPPTVAPLTTSFVEVDEITLDNKIRRIFSGWMFADSPGLHAVDHAVYDVWLTDCRGAEPKKAPEAAAPAAAPKPAEAKKPAEAPTQPKRPAAPVGDAPETRGAVTPSTGLPPLGAQAPAAPAPKITTPKPPAATAPRPSAPSQVIIEE